MHGWMGGKLAKEGGKLAKKGGKLKKKGGQNVRNGGQNVRKVGLNEMSPRTPRRIRGEVLGHRGLGRHRGVDHA